MGCVRCGVQASEQPKKPISGSDNMQEQKTIIQRMVDNEEILDLLLEVPPEFLDDIAEERREVLFSAVWENTTHEREEILSNVEDREEDFLEKYGSEAIPDAIIRMEAQDVLASALIEKLNAE